MDKKLFERYRVLVEFLGQALGPDYEIVLQDVGSESSGIVAIANGGVSGRTVGGPVTNIALRMIMQKQYEQGDYSLNYTGQLPNGKTIRSSTMFIKDGGKLVGLLCINFDDSRFHSLSDSILKLVHPDEFVRHHYFPVDAPAKPAPGAPAPDAPERFQSDSAVLMQDIFDEAVSAFGAAADRLTQEERTLLIASLYDMGLFQLKGAAQFAADKLGCSLPSIYRYISRVKAGQNV